MCSSNFNRNFHAIEKHLSVLAIVWLKQSKTSDIDDKLNAQLHVQYFSSFLKLHYNQQATKSSRVVARNVRESFTPSKIYCAASSAPSCDCCSSVMRDSKNSNGTAFCESSVEVVPSP